MSQEAIGEFFKRVEEDEALRQQFMSSVPQMLSGGAPIVEFAAKHGFSFSEEELKKAAAVVGRKTEELSDSELEAVAGGALNYSFASGSSGGRILSSLAQLRPGGQVMC
jgi:predicted ribosomally synthesized peptide with nif11-like leader